MVGRIGSGGENGIEGNSGIEIDGGNGGDRKTKLGSYRHRLADDTL